MWKSLGCCFFCDGVVILISIPVHCFSEPHLVTKTDSGLDVLFLELCRVSGLTSWMARKIFSPCYYFLSIIPLVSVTVLVLAIAEAAWPGRGRQALSPKGLLVSISHYIHVMAISTLHLCSQICTGPWEIAKKELVGWYYLGKKCYFRQNKNYKLCISPSISIILELEIRKANSAVVLDHLTPALP